MLRWGIRWCGTGQCQLADLSSPAPIPRVPLSKQLYHIHRTVLVSAPEYQIVVQIVVPIVVSVHSANRCRRQNGTGAGATLTAGIA